MNEIEKKLAAIPEVEPDKNDIEAIKRIKISDDKSSGVSLDEIELLRTEREYSGKISLRLPKSLHRDLIQAAKREGISLNQFLLYKLAR